MLLLLKQGDRQDLPAYETGTSVPTAPTTPPLSGEDSPYATRREDSYRPENAVAAKKPWMKISIGSLLVLALLGAGSYTIYSVTHSGSSGSGVGSSATQALSASRLSLPGISVDPPKGWTSFPVSGPGNLAMAPPGTGSCPNTPYGGPARCLEAVSISRRNLSTLPSGGDPKEALELLANERFDTLRASIRNTVVLSRKALTVDGCPSYLTEWRVSWLEPPDTIEVLVMVRTNVVSQNTRLASIFIRLASQSANSSRMLMNAIVSSVRCNS